MEKFLQIAVGILIIAAVYLLGMKRWDYASAAKRAAEKDRLKHAGLSVCYYFIPAGRLLLLNLLSGGFFLFYWSYKQWHAVRSGYKSSSAKSLKGGPLLRAAFTCFSFYRLTAIVNRTCMYLHKPPALPAAFWGTALWGGAAAACWPGLPAAARLAGAVLFFYAPYAVQKHVNLLPKQLPPSRLKAAEALCVPAGWLLWAALAYLCKIGG